MKYEELNKEQKKELIVKLYEAENKSFQDIATDYETYANKIRRDAKKFGINIRNKSDAQKNALSTGKHKHPTKGIKRNEDTKNKIGSSVMRFWDELSDSDLQKIKDKAKENWQNISEDQKKYIQQKANQAVRVASKDGSKLEKFLLEQLLSSGYRVDFHKEQSLVTTKLQIDLFIPTLNIAIEVDGPSHFLPVWGEDTLNKNIQYDNKKTGLILGKGLVLIRIKQTKEFSKARAYKIFEDLHKHIQNIRNKFPDKDNRYIQIGE
jgi:very-short-patch-repair endonuclease